MSWYICSQYYISCIDFTKQKSSENQKNSECFNPRSKFRLYSRTQFLSRILQYFPRKTRVKNLSMTYSFLILVLSISFFFSFSSYKGKINNNKCTSGRGLVDNEIYCVIITTYHINADFNENLF